VAEFPAWHPHADAWAILGAVYAIYLIAVRRMGPRYVEPGDKPVTTRQLWTFTFGILTLLVASLWPMHDLSERYLYSAHMVQHMLLALIAPPLLIRGTPEWLLRKLLRPFLPVARLVLRPLPAFLIFNAILVITHWPTVVTASVGSEPLHFGLHAVIVGSGLIMWWPVLSPLAELPRLSYPMQMLYLFLQSIVPTVPASFLTFGTEPLYHVYETFPRLWGLSALDDMRIAGLIMKLGGGFVLWGAIAVVWFRWASRSESDAPDTIEWQAVEREINRLPSAKP
jgi:putative membrane protein